MFVHIFYFQMVSTIQPIFRWLPPCFLVKSGWFFYSNCFRRFAWRTPAASRCPAARIVAMSREPPSCVSSFRRFIFQFQLVASTMRPFERKQNQAGMASVNDVEAGKTPKTGHCRPVMVCIHMRKMAKLGHLKMGTWDAILTFELGAISIFFQPRCLVLRVQRIWARVFRSEATRIPGSAQTNRCVQQPCSS